MGNKKISIIICSFVFLVFIGMASYSYFSSQKTLSASLPITSATPPGSYSFISNTQDNAIDLDITAVLMQQNSNLYGEVGNDNVAINVSLASPTNDDNVICDFDLVWTYDSTSDIYSDTGNYVPYTGYPYEISAQVLKNNNSQTIHNLDDYGSPINRKVKLGNFSISSNSTTATIDTYKVDVKVYNIPIDQTNIKNKHFKSSINVENVVCGYIDNNYQQVEYIESTGTQYIDTGYHFLSEQSEIIADLMITSNSGDQTLFGSEEYYGSTSSRIFSDILHGRNGTFAAYVGAGSNGSVNIGLNIRRIVDLATTLNKNLTIKLDGTTQLSKSYSQTILTYANAYNGASNKGNIFIFANHGDGVTSPIQHIGGMRLYSFKMYDGGELVRYFVPVYRRADRVAGLYDIVEGKFYTNPGSGSFIYGKNLDVVSDKNILLNGDFDNISIVSAPSKTVNSVTHTWDTNLNGIPGDTSHAYSASSWGNGSNMGVAVPEIGYHARIIKFNNNYVVDFHTNEAYNGQTDANVPGGVSVTPGTVKTLRWLGISQTIPGSNIQGGATYKLTMDVYSVTSGSYVKSGLYYSKVSNTTKSFYSGYGTFAPSTQGKWETISVTFTVASDYLASTNPAIYIYGYYVPGEIYADNVILEKIG